MDTVFSIVTSDIISRLISFLITKYKNLSTADKLERLQRLLLRARSIVEEAQGRQISNQGMLLQLRQLMEGMYQGYYILSTFQEPHTTSTRRNATVRQSKKLKKLQGAMEGLESTINGMKEFIVFLLDCPRFPQQPYNTHLFMEKCMFGRHEEKEMIRNFLLQPCDSPLSVLPIIGPREVGKNTLIEHVCNEESVRDHFSQIVRFKSDDLNNQDNESFIRGRELVVSSVMSLVVVELVNNDINDEAWRRFCSSIEKGCKKVIVISRVETISRLGTTQALKLKRLRRHEFWYFFRTLAFGSANPEEHPELLRIARMIATQIKGAFIDANIFARLLRANLNVKFWRYTLGFIKNAIELQLLVCGEHLWDTVSNSQHYYLYNHIDGPLHLCNGGYKTITDCLVKDELPKITADDMLIRTNAFSEGNFELLRWKSPIPPYYCYIANCVVKKAPHIVTKDKSLKRKRGIRKFNATLCTQ